MDTRNEEDNALPHRQARLFICAARSHAIDNGGDYDRPLLIEFTALPSHRFTPRPV